MPRYQFSGESEYKRHAQEGARTIDEETQESFRQQEMAHQQRMEALAAQREARVQQLQEAHERVLDAIASRKAAEAKALADKRVIYEDRLANAVVALHKIKRDDPDAMNQRNALVEKYPELRMNPKGDAKLHPDLEEFDKWNHAASETAAKQKEKTDLAKQEQDAAQAERDHPPKGLALKGFTNTKTGNRFESAEPSPRKTAAEIEKLQANFDKQHAAYTGSLGTEIGSDVAKNISRGVSRNAMVSSGRQLQKALSDNPDEAARVKADMDTALLLEHDRLKDNFTSSGDGRKYEVANPGVLTQFNQVKSALGYQPVKWDEAGKKYVEVAPETDPPSTLPKNAVGGDKSNSQFVKDAGAAGNAVTNPPPDFTSKFNTPIPPEKQQEYAAWKAKYAPNDSGSDYDYAGAFLAGENPSGESGHFTDKFKKPNHPTFSNESQYNGTTDEKGVRYQGGKWGDNDSFTPGTTNLTTHGVEALQKYFKEREPNSKLILTPSGVVPPANPSTGAPVIPPAPNPELTPMPAPDATPPPVADVTGGPAKVVPGPTPHPMEGQTVRHKASGQMGKIINGQFVPD